MLSTYPEDSVLRRHAIAAEKMMGRAARKYSPTDSVLQRHYRQLQEIRLPGPSDAPKAHPKTSPAPSATGREPAAPAASASAQTSDYTAPPPGRGGMLGFFRRLLGL